MATITTKYSVGDTVWYANTVTTKKQHPCPDCLGEKRWTARSPAGGEFEFSCPRCSASYHHDRDLSLAYSAFEPVASKLTIGSVRVNTHPGSYDSGNSYMCVETGVGGGTIYAEDRLFDSEAEALAAAALLADAQNSETQWVVRQFDRSLSLSDYQIDSAKLKLAEEAASRAHSMLWNLGYLFDQISEAEDKDAITEAVDFYRNYDWENDKDKIAAELSKRGGRAAA